MATAAYKIPTIQVPTVPGGAIFPGTVTQPYRYDPTFLKFDLQTGNLYTETAKETIDKSNEALENLNPVTVLTGFLTEHQTDYIVGGIGLVLIFAGIFAIVQTVKPI